MKLNPIKKTSDYGYIDGYIGLLETADIKVISEYWMGSYQGDLVVVVHDPENDNYGFTVIGYGSCSGCDSLEACRNVSELTNLRDDIVNDIKWRTTKQELIDYIVNKDHAGEYYCWNSDEWLGAVDSIGKDLKMSEEEIATMKANGNRWNNYG